MNRSTRPADRGSLRDRMDALIERMAEPTPEGGPALRGDEKGSATTKGLPGDADETSLDDNRLRVPGA